jgi:hypothetical protein
MISRWGLVGHRLPGLFTKIKVATSNNPDFIYHVAAAGNPAHLFNGSLRTLSR